MYSMTVMAAAPARKSSTRVQNTLSIALYFSSETIRYSAHSPRP